MKKLAVVLAGVCAFAAAPALAQDAPVLGHWMVAISVADMDAETAFYDKLGFKVELDTTFGPGIPVRWLTSGSERIELLQIKDSKPMTPPRPKPPGHAAVQGFSQITLSTSDIEATKLHPQELAPANSAGSRYDRTARASSRSVLCGGKAARADIGLDLGR